MVWSDGRYGMGKSEKGGWDDGGVDTLADWYAPHVEAWGRVCAPSATVYLWGTAEGWARLDPVMRAAGWRYSRLLTWDKGDSIMGALPLSPEDRCTWPDVTEVCGVYQRDAWSPVAAREAVLTAGLRAADIDAAAGVACMASRKWLGTDTQARSPSEVDLVRVRGVLPRLGWPWTLGRPRAEFACPLGVSNVWRHPIIPGSSRERVRLPGGETHPCQKPLAFADRAIRASTRIGDTILDPFAGTNRIAVACRRLPEEERRHAIGIEMDQRWLDAVRPSLVAEHGHTDQQGQMGLFGRGRS